MSPRLVHCVALSLALLALAACDSPTEIVAEPPAPPAPATPEPPPAPDSPAPDSPAPGAPSEAESPPPTPRLSPTLADRPRLVLGESRGIAIGDDGGVYVFPLARGTSSTRAARVAGVDGAQSVAVAHDAYCAVTDAHETLCWHERGARYSPYTETPTPVPGLAGAVAVAMFADGACVRDDAGAVRCVGRRWASAGDARAVTIPLPGPVVQIAGSGRGYTLTALLQDGRVFVSDGEPPREVRLPFAVSALAMDGDSRCVLGATGVACEGDIGNWYYEDVDYEDEEMGPVSAMSAPVPMMPVPHTDGVLAVAMNWMSACALLRGGSLSCWGAPYRDGRTEGFQRRAVAGLRGATEVVAGGPGSVADGVVCAVIDHRPVCFSTPRSLGAGTPGRPGFVICRADAEVCVPLSLARRDADGTVRAAPAAAVAPAADAPEINAAEPPAPVAPPPGCVVVDSSGSPLNVRAEPSVRAEVVATIPDATPVVVDERRGRFAHLSAPVVGWAWGESIRCP